jgi:purine-binding chemotaxis protein CheW
MSAGSTDRAHLIFELQDQLFGIPYERLVQIIDSPKVTALPSEDDSVRGIIDFLGETLVLYDFRKILGSITLEEEISNLIRTLADRRQDHVNWLTKLKAAVNAGQEITVQTDPHKCAFGKWYDSFKTKSLALTTFLARFDEPHKTIHGLATRAQALMKTGQAEEAKAIIRAAEHREFLQLMDLFGEAETRIRATSFEYAIVVERDGGKLALTVDDVRAFESFSHYSDHVPPLLKKMGGGLIQGIGQRDNEGTLEDVLVMDMDRLLATA